MATDDERRRVARNIRKNYIRAGIGYRTASAYNIALAVGIVPEMIVEDIELWNRLADLIDPGDVIPVEVCELEGDGTPEGEPLPPIVDREALLALAGILKTPEQDADCGACPLRKWCDTELYNGHRITCFECRTWHAADAILEACGERAS